MPPGPPDDPRKGPDLNAKPHQRPTRVLAASTGKPTQEIAQHEAPESAEPRDAKLMTRTEDLADRALDRLKSEVGLPNVLEEAEGLARTVGAIRSRALAGTVALYVLTASVGIAATLVEGLHDWFMHAAMYVVILSFLVIYVKSHLMHQVVARGFYALATCALMGFFAWVLQDLVPARIIVVDGHATERAAAGLLRLPSVMLLVAASGLLVHWLFLARHDVRR